MSLFTVFVQEASGRGTMHIASYEAEDAQTAAEMALEETASDWGADDTDNLRVLGIALGDVEILEWNDLE